MKLQSLYVLFYAESHAEVSEAHFGEELVMKNVSMRNCKIDKM